MSQQVNYAFLAALYSNERAELYSEVFFPALLYGLYGLYSDQKEITHYYIVENLQNKVMETLGVKIPLIVIRTVLPQIGKRFPDIELSLLSKGDQFEIRKVWSAGYAESILHRAISNSSSFKQLEDRFVQFKKQKNIDDDSSFLLFLSNNLERIIEGGPKMSEEIDGIHVAEFLNGLKQQSAALYSFAADMYWASIIGAYLQRDVNTLGKLENKVVYYLDTAIALAVLGLDCLANVQYYTEMVKMILQSNHKVMVHQFTIEEMNSVIDSPRQAFSGLSQAIARGVTEVQILGIKQDLEKELSSHGIGIEKCSSAALFEARKKLEKNQMVKELAKLRFNEPSAREMHDIYMYNLIAAKQGNETRVEKCKAFFITLNADYERFCKELAPSFAPRVISPTNVIRDVWMHSAISSIDKKEILNEAVTRCVALNRSNSIRKVSEVVRCYKEETYSPEMYVALQDRIYARSRPVLDAVFAMEESNDYEEKKKLAERAMALAQQEYEETRKKEANATKERALQDKKRKEEVEQIKKEYEEKVKEYDNTHIGLEEAKAFYEGKKKWDDYQVELADYVRGMMRKRFILFLIISMAYSLIYVGLIVFSIRNYIRVIPEGWSLPKWLLPVLLIVFTVFPILDLFLFRANMHPLPRIFSYVFNKDQVRKEYREKIIKEYKEKNPEPQEPSKEISEKLGIVF